MTINEKPLQRLTLQRALIALAVAVATGVLLVLAPYAFVWLQTGAALGGYHDAMTASSGIGVALTIVLPFVQGFALGTALGPKRYGALTTIMMGFALAAVDLIGAAIVFREGVICLLMLSPLLVALLLAGALIGRLVAHRSVSPTLHASLIPLIVLSVFAEASGPKPDFAASVTDAVTIKAPPDYVWRYVLTYPENTAPAEYWLWRIGLPEPIQSVAQAPRVGALRVCRFTGGAAFEERISELTPNRSMTFVVTRQPDDPEVLGHFRFDLGQIQLRQNPDGSTTVIATSWYHLFVRPGAYFDLWAGDITRQVHVRVLGQIKRLAEHDYRAAHTA